MDPEQIAADAAARAQTTGPTAPHWGDEEPVRTVEVDPQSGRRYVAEDGVFVSWMDPVPPSGGGGSSVTVNASTGGAFSSSQPRSRIFRFRYAASLCRDVAYRLT